jgi:hypothetical protein
VRAGVDALHGQWSSQGHEAPQQAGGASTRDLRSEHPGVTAAAAGWFSNDVTTLSRSEKSADKDLTPNAQRPVIVTAASDPYVCNAYKNQYIDKRFPWSSWSILLAQLVAYHLGTDLLASYVSWCMGMTDAPALPGTKRAKTQSSSSVNWR